MLPLPLETQLNIKLGYRIAYIGVVKWWIRQKNIFRLQVSMNNKRILIVGLFNIILLSANVFTDLTKLFWISASKNLTKQSTTIEWYCFFLFSELKPSFYDWKNQKLNCFDFFLVYVYFMWSSRVLLFFLSRDSVSNSFPVQSQHVGS